MSRELKHSRDFIYNCLEYLELSGLIIGVKKEATGFKAVRKAGKLLPENTNLLNVITDNMKAEAQTGSLRESFFVNQLRHQHS
ncbi:MAG: hypothetical protein OCC49_07495 [Fibrobacterales bacterium]